ncbi:sugar transporter SWEET1-like [Liolophura sinensis]|uniref:sugar transporter SWEET1-like n=1 Tax=Liolophura sinensis TaxID=3198878 RepID=UPI003158CF60
MDTFTSIEWLTQIATLVMFAAGIPPCWHMYKTGNTRGVPYYFFLLGGINNIMAVYYGILINNSVILFLNIVGTVLNGMYSFTYIYVAHSKKSALFQLMLGAGWLIGLAYYLTVFVESPQTVTYQLGLILCLITTVLLTSPVFEILDCIKQRSVADMSVAMLFGGLVCSALWLFYGMLLGDFFIYAPNFPGVATGVGKLVLLVNYGGGEKTEKTSKKLN